MLIAVIACLYTIGYILCYLWMRAIVRDKRQEDWLLLEKIVVITISSLSWVAIISIIMLIVVAPVFKIDFDKKCKW